jgi:hypothetical protein
MASPTLSFAYDIVSQDRNPYLESKYDRFTLEINGTSVFTDAKKSGDYGCHPGGEVDLGWRTKQIDLTPYKGQRITIRFENISTFDYEPGFGWYNTWTFVDDVRIIP